MRTRASIITIGDELLIGQVINTNAAWIAQQLDMLNIAVVCQLTVADTREAIWGSIDAVFAGSDLVIMTGGLGPTADDVTKPALCAYFGGTMVVNEVVLQHVTDFFVKRNRPMLERNVKQAEVPDCCKVIFNRLGTAPGMWFEKEGKILVSLPGVPFEMKTIFTEELIPRFKSYWTSDAIVHKTIYVYGLGESFLAEKIIDIEEVLPGFMHLAYLPSQSIVRLRLSGTHKDPVFLEQEMSAWHHKIAARVQANVFAMEDKPIEVLIKEAATRNNSTISAAESCTSGAIASTITNVWGASGYFKGGVVAYATGIKEEILYVDAALIEEYGVVSQEVAEAMAMHVKRLFQTDYAVSITGNLEPNPMEKEKDAVAWISVATPAHVSSHKLPFFYDRIRNKEIAVQLALVYLLKTLQA